MHLWPAVAGNGHGLHSQYRLVDGQGRGLPHCCIGRLQVFLCPLCQWDLHQRANLKRVLPRAGRPNWPVYAMLHVPGHPQPHDLTPRTA
jgi:hypothetical protein